MRSIGTSETRSLVLPDVEASAPLRRATVFACVFILGLDGGAAATTHRPASLVSLGAAKLAHCERSGLVRPVCPRRVPRVGAAYLSNLAVELTGRSMLDVFNLERGGEDPRHPERNRPPRMGHIVAVAGNVERLAPFREPRRARGKPLRDGAMLAARAGPLSFGRVRWAGRVGALYLMAPFPRGGMLGNHLVFSWRQGGRRYAFSLHAWEPLTESATTLRKMVAALPSVRASERLTRLSPVRRGMMPPGVSTKRFRVVAPPHRRYKLAAFVVVPARADIAVRIESGAGDVLRILDSTRTRGCKVRRPLRTCFLRVPKLHAIRGGRWTIVLTKRSLSPARVRVDLGFR